MSPNLSGQYASPVNSGEGINDLVFTYDSRALNTEIADGTYYFKIKFIDNLPTNLKFEYGEAIPWFNKMGNADQIKSSLKFFQLKNGEHYEIIEKRKFTDGKWVVSN